MKKSIVRPLKRGDLPRVAHLVDVNKMIPPEMLDGMTGPFFAGKTDTCRWIVFAEDQVKGVAYYVPELITEGTWNVLMIAVDPDVQGKGIGSHLMRFIEAELAGEGNRILLVETSGTPEFERTRGFYDMLGYHREAIIRDYYAAGDDKVIFSKALN